MLNHISEHVPMQYVCGLVYDYRGNCLTLTLIDILQAQDVMCSSDVQAAVRLSKYRYDD